MKKKDFIESIQRYSDDHDIFIDGSSEFVIEEAGDADNRTLNILKR